MRLRGHRVRSILSHISDFLWRNFSSFIAHRLLLITALFLASCSSSIRFSSEKISLGSGGNSRAEKENFPPAQPKNSSQEKILREAERWLGTPYCYGGNSSSCTDCSGFVAQVYLSYGMKIPRTSIEQFNYGRKISAEEAEIGDLVFFKLETGKEVSHVGIYVGNYQFIHASTSRGVVRQSLYDIPFSAALAGYRRILKNS